MLRIIYVRCALNLCSAYLDKKVSKSGGAPTIGCITYAQRRIGVIKEDEWTEKWGEVSRSKVSREKCIEGNSCYWAPHHSNSHLHSVDRQQQWDDELHCWPSNKRRWTYVLYEAGYYEMVYRCGLFMSAKRLMEIERFSIKYVHGCLAKLFLTKSIECLAVVRDCVPHSLWIVRLLSQFSRYKEIETRRRMMVMSGPGESISISRWLVIDRSLALCFCRYLLRIMLDSLAIWN